MSCLQKIKSSKKSKDNLICLITVNYKRISTISIGIVVATIFVILFTIKWIRSFLLTHKLSKQYKYDLMNLDGYLFSTFLLLH